MPVTFFLAVHRDDRVLGILEHIVLDAKSCTHARVNARIDDIIVVIVEQMTLSEAEQRTAGVDVLEAVVMIGDLAVVVVAVRRSYEGRLPAVMEIVVGDGDVFGIFLHIEQAVIIVLVHIQAGIDLVVVDPDIVGRPFDADAVLIPCVHMVNLQVLDDDVACPGDLNPDAVQFTVLACTEDRDIADILDIDLAVRIRSPPANLSIFFHYRKI